MLRDTVQSHARNRIRPHGFVLICFEDEEEKEEKGNSTAMTCLQSTRSDIVNIQPSNEEPAAKQTQTEASVWKIPFKGGGHRANHNHEIGKLIATDAASGCSKEETSDGLAILDMLLDMAEDE
jgi:hypothetical protein